MISQVDEALRDIIRSEALQESSIEVVFDAPTKDWAARRNAPTVNVYLYDIREDLRRRERGWSEQRNDGGTVVARRPAPKFFKLSYLVTAWTQRPEDEHRLLDSLLRAFLLYDALPRRLVTGPLAETRLDVPMTVGLPPPEDRAFADVWSALGGELKPSLDLVVVAPVAHQASGDRREAVEARRSQPTGDGAERLARRETPRGLAHGQLANDVAEPDTAFVRDDDRGRVARNERVASPPLRSLHGFEQETRAVARHRGNRPTGVPTSASSSAQTGTSGHSEASRSNVSRSGRIWRVPTVALISSILSYGVETHVSPGGNRGSWGCDTVDRVRRPAAPGSTSPRATTSRSSAYASGRRWWHGEPRGVNRGRGGPIGTHPSAILPAETSHRWLAGGGHVPTFRFGRVGSRWMWRRWYGRWSRVRATSSWTSRTPVVGATAPCA